MRIQELESRTGLERPSIRYYEREGLLTPNRLENGYRDYSEADAQQLLKIKLLRQLGMRVERIKQLQQGSADFSEVLTEQIKALSSQIDEHRRARAVCQAIQADGAEYQTLDTNRYLKLLLEIKIDDHALGRDNFQENIPEEIHPWRRYIARSIDLALFSVMMQFLLFVVFRLRPIPEEFLMTLIGIGIGFLYIPVEALLLHKFGTTPGKWAMGIRLEWIQGGNLPYLEALYRSWRVLKQGMGFGIPLVELIFVGYCHAKLTGRPISRWQRYNEIDPPAPMDWDEDTEIIYSAWEGKWLCQILPLAAVWALLVGITVTDMVKPKYRGADLTISQFAENYNNTLALTYPEHDIYDTLQPNGCKYPIPNSVGVVYVAGEPQKEQADFVYETESGFLRTISYENSWRDVFYLMPIDADCFNAAASVLLAQDNFGLLEMAEFTQLWESKQDQTEVSFQYKNIEIRWQIGFENCMFIEGILLPENQDLASSADISFLLTICESE